jgi:hypothetical protein
VAFLNASKVLTTGSALTFDGSKLTVKGGDAGQFVIDNNGERYLQALFTRNGAVNSGADLLFDGTDSTFAIRTLAVAPIVFSVSASAGAPAEGMRLTSTGLGIGTSSPLSKLNAMGTQGNWRIDPDSVSSEIQLFSTTVANDGFRDFRIRTQQTMFDTAGAERMRIDSSGNVGIGTSSPANKLSIVGGNGNQLSLDNTGQQFTQIDFNNNGSTQSRIWNNGSGNLLTLQTTSGRGISFETNGTAERMRITSAGNVGIGTTSPATLLHLNTSDAANDVLRITNGTLELNMGVNNGSGGSYLFEASNNALRFGTNNVERMRIDSAGNVGIGTSSPAAKLDVAGTVSFNGGGVQFPIQFVNSFTPNAERADILFAANATSNNAVRIGSIASNAGVTIQGTRQNDSASKVNLVFQPDGGNVGIGTTAPASKLEVSGSGTLEVARFATTTDNTPSIGIYSNGSIRGKLRASTAETALLSQGALPLLLGTNDTERARIDSSGNFGIGTTSLTSRFKVTSSSAESVIARFTSTGSSACFVGFAGSGAGTEFDVACGAVASNVFSINTSATERMRIDSSGNLLVGTTSAAAGSSNTIYYAASSNWAFRAESGNASPAGTLIKFSGASPNNTGNHFFYCQDSGDTERMSVRSNGGIANYSANDANLSDRREKTNFAPAKSYLDVICAIPVQTFNYIDQNLAEDDGLTLGVVAQDVQTVAPELVMESNWGTKDNPKMRLSVYQTDLQYALMKAVQEMKSIIDSQAERIAALEAK